MNKIYRTFLEITAHTTHKSWMQLCGNVLKCFTKLCDCLIRVLHYNITGPHWEAALKQMQEQTWRFRVKYVSGNWHSSYFFLSLLSSFLPLSHSVSLCWPSGQSICLFSLSFSDLSFTITRAIQKHTTLTQSARLLGQLCVSTALSHISAHCSKKSSPRLHMHARIHTNTNTHTHNLTFSTFTLASNFICLSMICTQQLFS